MVKWDRVSSICSFGFGLLHLYWAVGGRIGLSDEMGDIGDRMWFLVYDLVAAVVFLVLGIVAAMIRSTADRRSLRRKLVVACWWGGLLSLLRGGPALVQDAFMYNEMHVGYVYDVVFTVGGLLFMQTARMFREVGTSLWTGSRSSETPSRDFAG